MRLILFLLSVTMILGCQDQYQCQCIDNFNIQFNDSSISGLTILPANVVAESSASFKVLVDNTAKNWDGITIKLFDEDREYWYTDRGVEYISITNPSLVLSIPTSSLTHNNKTVIGEVQYEIGLFLQGDFVQLTGSIGVISCDNFFEDFDATECRWSCHISDFGNPLYHCSPECPF